MCTFTYTHIDLHIDYVHTCDARGGMALCIRDVNDPVAVPASAPSAGAALPPCCSAHPSHSCSWS